MIKLSYSTNGLTNLDLFQAIDAVEGAGFSGIELAFHQKQFNPFQRTAHDIIKLQKKFETGRLRPACIAPPTFFFLPERPHDPSIICVDLAGRKQRIHLIKEAIRFAKALGAPIVSFGSGFIRDEHLRAGAPDPEALLIDSVHQCLENSGDVILTIEPEPGMYVETLEQGVDIVKKVNSEKFRLHIDLCHAFCSDLNYIEAIRRAAPYTKYLHVSDSTDGCNLKVISFQEDLVYNFNFASYLMYFPDTADFLFIDPDHSLYFYDKPLSAKERASVEELAQKINAVTVRYIDYNSLFMGRSPYYDEINVYAISLPNLSFCVIDRVRPIVHYLKITKSDKTHRPIIEKKVANSLTGKVHFHDIPGVGQIDFTSCFDTLRMGNFSGYATVELYHHVDMWQDTLQESFNFLSQCLTSLENRGTIC